VPTAVQEGDVLVGKYRVERVLGSGGMGIIIAARHIRLDQRVAIKFLAPDAFSDPAAVVRFDREARAAAKIKNPHVAQVTDVGTLDDGTPYLVMEYLEGEDLAALLRREGFLPVADAVDLVLQACEGIGEAHRFGIVHRDIKPANLFCLRQPDGSRWIKVLDFGISKHTNLAPTTRGMAATGASTIMGSPLYMSPEQMQSARTVDERTDIWGLGIILYELLAGEVPFKGGNLPEVCLNVTTQPPPPLQHVRPDTPPALQRIILRCLEKDYTKRFSNVAELAEALLPFAPGRAWMSFPRRHPSAGPAPSTVSLRPPTPHTKPPSSPSLPDSSWGHTKKRLAAAHGRSRALAIAAMLASTIGVGAVVWWKGEPWLRSIAPARSVERGGAGAAPISASTAQVLPSPPITSTAPRHDLSPMANAERREALFLPAPPVQRPSLTQQPSIAARRASPGVPRAVPPRNPASPTETTGQAASNARDPGPPSKTASASPAASQRVESGTGGTSPSCTLIITSVPPSEVLLDGVRLGPTPLFGVAASSGVQHTVTFIHPQDGKSVSTVSCRTDEVKRIAGRFGPAAVRPELDPNPYR
jgi:eukaryotic-like serine/threonine-protein kinase